MEYWDIARKHVDPEKLVLDYRSPDEAGDKVKIFDYLKGGRAKIFGDNGGAFILALPTVPLRRSEHVDEAIAMFERERRPVFSATSYGFPITFAFRIDEQGEWTPVFEDTPLLNGNTRSQNQPAAYHPNGAIYVRSIADLDRPDLRSLFEGAKPYLMDPLDSVDIDGEPDFAIAAALLQARAAARS
jgi:CMP-N-acetylneuraminic acid synthetase